MSEDAASLMERVRKRDAAAFEALYDDYHRLAYGLAMRMLGDAATAEDITQAVFVKVWSSPELFRTGNFAAWIARITRNRVLDLLRSHAVRSETDLPQALPETESIEDVAFAHIDRDLVMSALAALPDEQRLPIEMGFFGGITHQEIARRTGTPLGTVKTRIRSGLRRLRTKLETTVGS